MRTEPTIRSIHGRTDNVGNILAGTGFIVQKGSTGSYVVRFTPPFKALISMRATPFATGAWHLDAANFASDQVTIFAYNASNTLQDIAFAFEATGIPA